MISTGKLKALIARLTLFTAYKQVEISADYQMLAGDRSIISNGDNDVTFVLLANAEHDVVMTSETDTITLLGNGATIIGATTVTALISRRYTPRRADNSWLEVT